MRSSGARLDSADTTTGEHPQGRQLRAAVAELAYQADEGSVLLRGQFDGLGVRTGLPLAGQSPERVAMTPGHDFGAVPAQKAYQADDPDDGRQGEGGHACQLEDRHVIGHAPQ